MAGSALLGRLEQQDCQQFTADREEVDLRRQESGERARP
jgi:hypothetical protein